jgi:hypothetical protein
VTAGLDGASDGANVLMSVLEDDPRAKSVVESFADGHIVSLVSEGSTMVVGLRMPGAQWPAQVAQAEARLDRLGGDWRGSVTFRRP